MLDNNIIELSSSEWSSPYILVPKSDGSYRFVMDYRKLNAMTKSNSFPVPRINDCIDKIGNARYISKFDQKDYWQVPLTDRAKEVSAFVVDSNLYQYKVMPFGMKNASAKFQRMMHLLLNDLRGCEVNINDMIIYSKTFILIRKNIFGSETI